ncbi:MAG: sulfite oxidase heme-binding subunit YedZ [Omnitrophica WOR_2 bacterium]
MPLRKYLLFSPLRIAIHTGSWLPLIWLTWAYLSNHLTVNPIQAATQFTGRVAIILLVLSLACTPINTLFHWGEVLRFRRALGLYAFLYAAIHLYIVVGIDYGFAFDLLWGDLNGKPYIYAGAASMLILVLLAVTSFRWWMKYLGKGWKRLHQLVYIAAPLAVLHYGWAKKGDFLALRGDILQPLIYGIVVMILLIMRFPPIRKEIVRIRGVFSRWVHEVRATFLHNISVE